MKMLLLLSIILMAVNGCSDNVKRESENSQNKKQNDKYFKLASSKLDSMKIPHNDREKVILFDENAVTVKYICPTKMLGGDFVIKFNKVNNEIIDVNINR